MEHWELKLGEERAVKLPLVEPPGEWRAEVGGMASAVRVHRLWPSAPYPVDDDDEAARPEPYLVFTIRGSGTGEALVRFVPVGGGSLPPTREIDVSVVR